MIKSSIKINLTLFVHIQSIYISDKILSKAQLLHHIAIIIIINLWVIIAIKETLLDRLFIMW